MDHIAKIALGLLLLVAGACGGDAADDDTAMPDDDVADDDTGGGDDDTQPSPFGNGATFVSQSVPTPVTEGADFDVEITMQNTGETTWTFADEHRLGSQNPQDGQTWGLGRVDLDESDTIGPGSSHTFVFTATAPASAGAYEFQWRMLQEAVEWFGDYTDNLTITVEEGDACSNGVLDAGETDVDCGGPCDACPPVLLSSGNHHSPVVAATDELVIVTFSDEDDSQHLQYMCNDGSGWIGPQRVPDLGDNSEFSRMEPDSQGRVHLVAHQGMAAGRGVYVLRFDGGSGCGGSWSTPTRVDDGTRNSCWPAIAIDENDEPHVFWTEDYLQMQYNRYAGGSWDGPFMVIDTPDEQSCHGDVTVAGTTAHVAWQEGTSPRLPTWSHWTGAGFAAPETLTASFHNWPQIVADGHGRIHVLYTYRYGDHEVKYVCQDGGVWSAEITVSTGATEWAWSDMEADGDGVLHASWSQHPPGNRDHAVYARADGATGVWEAPRQVSEDGSLDNINTSISVDPSGRAHVVWMMVDDPWAEADEPGPVYYRRVTWDDLVP